MLNPGEMNIDNSGANEGIIIGLNSGPINYMIKEPVKIYSMISSVVKTLSSVCVDDENLEYIENLEAFRLEQKMEYNSIIKYKEIIQEHAIYYTHCEDMLNIFDDSNIGSKSKILRCVRNWYLERKGQLILESQNNDITDIDVIRMNADSIIDGVIFKMKQNIYDSNPLISIEEIEIGIICFVCYSFMKCKILEKPK